MLKYSDYNIVCQEIPDEVTLAINITGCTIHCRGCHSVWLWEDSGEVLCSEEGFSGLENIVQQYAQCITCVCFMGGDSRPDEVVACANRVRSLWPSLKTGWYSGKTALASGVDARSFDYLKLGPYIAELGGLRSPMTNQKLYRVGKEGIMIPIAIYDPHNVQ